MGQVRPQISASAVDIQDASFNIQHSTFNNDSGSTFNIQNSTLMADAEGRVILTLPDDFLSLLSLRLNGWERPVREVLRADHWLYRLQAMRWTGLRGSPQRPLAFFTTDEEGHPALELFSSMPNAPVTVTEFRYLASRFCGEDRPVSEEDLTTLS